MGLIKNYAVALYEFLNDFAPTYREPVVYDEENPMPEEYITYSCNVSNFSEMFIQPFTIYSRSTGFSNLMDIVDNIEKQIGEKGIIIRKDWGYLTIEKGSPFYQDKPDEDESVRAGYINLLIKVYQKEI